MLTNEKPALLGRIRVKDDAGQGIYPTKASNSSNAERGKRRSSFAILTCKASRATHSIVYASE
ncbi:hypothetical protein [Luteibacter sp. CQ10]|uniref:hypothetical protein n=1 Tax=Luteibacter sp. CQ10 TaxID=2805821 RepID=UPI0034A3A2A4